MSSALSGWAKRWFFMVKITALAGVCALVVQPLTAVPASAATEDVAQLNYITAEQTIGIGEISDELRVQSQNADGEAEQLGISGADLIITSDSPTGEFSSNGEDGWTSNGSFNFNSDYTSRGFHYRDTTPGVHALTAHIQDDDTAYDWQVTQHITVTAPEPVLASEEFATVDGRYKGISVGFRVQYFNEVSDVIVEVTREDGSVVTKRGNDGVRDLASQTDTPQQLTTPFVIQEGDFTEASDTYYWQPAGEVEWTKDTCPVSVKITVIDEHGEAGVVNEQFLDGPAHPMYESLLPEIPEELPDEPVLPDENNIGGRGGAPGTQHESDSDDPSEKSEEETSDTSNDEYEGEWIGPGIIGTGGLAYMPEDDATQPQDANETSPYSTQETDENTDEKQDTTSSACAQWFGACWYWWVAGIITLGGVGYALWRGRNSSE